LNLQQRPVKELVPFFALRSNRHENYFFSSRPLLPFGFGRHSHYIVVQSANGCTVAALFGGPGSANNARNCATGKRYG
jgi:hypothetical protein